MGKTKKIILCAMLVALPIVIVALKYRNLGPQISLTTSIISAVGTLIAVLCALWGIEKADESIKKADESILLSKEGIIQAEKSFKKSMTAQVELYVLSTIKETLLESGGNKQVKKEKLNKFLMTLDYWCKLALNDCLDKELFEDNIDFIKDQIKEHKIDIARDPKGYNNLVEYARQNQITLERAPNSRYGA